MIQKASGEQIDTSSDILQTICVLPTPYIPHNLNPMSGPGREYFDRDIHFYQLFSVGLDLRLSHALCATRRILPERASTKFIRYQTIVAPTATRAAALNIKSSTYIVDDQFIVPDGLEDNGDMTESAENTMVRSKKENHLAKTINARRLFEICFPEILVKNDSTGQPLETAPTVKDYSEEILQCFRIRKEHGQQGLTPL